MRILVTGATGIVGTEVARTLDLRIGTEVLRTSRRGDPRTDTVAWNIGAEDPPRRLGGSLDVVIHTAANTSWNQADDEAWHTNVETTARLVEFAAEARLVFVSTAFVHGARAEGSLSRGDFRNAYEWSKACAEQVVSDHPDAVIVRPPLIVGRRDTGAVARFSGLYILMRSYVTGLLPVLVADPDARVEVVAVDDAAAAITEAIHRPGRELPIVMGAGDSAPSVGTLVDRVLEALNRWRNARGVEPIVPLRVIRREQWERFFLPFARDALDNRQLRILDLLAAFLPYLNLVDPPRPNWLVAPVTNDLQPIVDYWAERHSRIAVSQPSAWRSRIADDISDSRA